MLVIYWFVKNVIVINCSSFATETNISSINIGNCFTSKSFKTVWNVMHKKYLWCKIQLHCAKSVRIQSLPGLYFLAFGLNTETFRIFRLPENTDQENPGYRHFSPTVMYLNGWSIQKHKGKKCETLINVQGTPSNFFGEHHKKERKKQSKKCVLIR